MSTDLPSPLLFVINPISGGKHKDEQQAAIKKFYSASVQKIAYFLLTGKNDADNLKTCIEQVRPQIAIAIGGDGTVAMVAKLISGTAVRLGIIPAGSANGMARELQIPLEINEALEVIQNGQVKKADIISINNDCCIHLSDIGLNARLIRYFDEGNMRGKLGYAKVFLKVLLRKQRINVSIKAKDKEIKRVAFMVVLANATKYGTGAVINPKGNLFDGLFEVVIVKQISFWTFLKLWIKPAGLDPDKVEVIQAEEVHIQMRRKADFQVDGEYKGKVKRVDAKIMKGILNIVLPLS